MVKEIRWMKWRRLTMSAASLVMLLIAAGAKWRG